MNPDQIQRLRDAIARNHQPVDKRAPHRVYLSGWNEAMDFVARTIEEITGKKDKPA